MYSSVVLLSCPKEYQPPQADRASAFVSQKFLARAWGVIEHSFSTMQNSVTVSHTLCSVP